MVWSAGCTPLSLPDPVIHGVSPAHAYNGKERVVTIEGERFYPEVRVPASGIPDINPFFEGWLTGPASEGRPIPFSSMTLKGEHEITATLSRDWPPGRYSVTVVGPNGGRDTLESAFVVTDEAVDRLRIHTDQFGPYRVGDPLRLTVTALDVASEVVQAPVEVQVVARMSDREARVTVRGVSTTLVEWTAIQGGAVGTLLDGTGDFTIHTERTGGVEVTATAPLLDDVRPGREVYHFSASTDVQVDFDLPYATDGVFVVGERYTVLAEPVDEFGNQVSNLPPGALYFRSADEPYPLFLDTAELDGPTLITVTFAEAAEQAWLQWDSGAGASRSETFTVVAADSPVGVCGTEHRSGSVAVDECLSTSCCGPFGACDADAACSECIESWTADCSDSELYDAFGTCSETFCPSKVCGTALSATDSSGTIDVNCNRCTTEHCCGQLEDCMGENGETAADCTLCIARPDSPLCADQAVRAGAVAYLTCQRARCSDHCE